MLGRNGDNDAAKMMRRINVFNQTCQIEAQNYQLQLNDYLKNCHEHNKHCAPCSFLYNQNVWVSAHYMNLIKCIQV